MVFLIVLGGLYVLILLFRATRTYGGFSKIPDGVITNISARFGIIMGFVLAFNSILILAGALAGSATGWFLGGIVAKGVFVCTLGIYLFVKCLRLVKADHQ